MAKTVKKEMEIKVVLEKCFCPKCPTYVDCGARGFCHSSQDKSKCIKKEQGCLCPACPVEQAMGYLNVFYCTRGNANIQSAKR